MFFSRNDRLRGGDFIILSHALTSPSNLSPIFRASLLEIFYDPASARDLDIELAAMIDAGKHFVQATYYLEGDGPLVFTSYERFSALAHAIDH